VAQIKPKYLALTDRNQWHKSNRNIHLWPSPSEAYLQEKGSTYISKLKEGLENSKFLNGLTKAVDYIERLWNQGGVKNAEKINEELVSIHKDFKIHNSYDITEEAFIFLERDVIHHPERKNIVHPILTIEDAMGFFRILIKQVD